MAFIATIACLLAILQTFLHTQGQYAAQKITINFRESRYGLLGGYVVADNGL